MNQDATIHKCTCRKDGKIHNVIHDPGCALNQFGGLESFFHQSGKTPKYLMYCPFIRGECIKEDCAAFSWQAHDVYLSQYVSTKGQWCGKTQEKYAHCGALNKDLRTIPPKQPPEREPTKYCRNCRQELSKCWHQGGCVNQDAPGSGG